MSQHPSPNHGRERRCACQVDPLAQSVVHLLCRCEMAEENLIFVAISLNENELDTHQSTTLTHKSNLIEAAGVAGI